MSSFGKAYDPFYRDLFFRVPGTLGNKLKTLKGIRFSHFGDAFCRYGFQAGSGGGLFVEFHAF